MIFYLRNQSNQTIVDIEMVEKKDGFLELTSGVMIEEYSKFLLDNLNRKDEIVEDFSFLDEFRGWFYEVYLENTDDVTYNMALEKIRTILQAYAEKYDLIYVED